MKARAYTDEDQLITGEPFLGPTQKKRFESVKRHRQWQAQLQRDEFFGRVFATRAKGSVSK